MLSDRKVPNKCSDDIGHQAPPKPLLKWVGGKTQIIHKILDSMPAAMQNYHELFVGGGSVLLGVLHRIRTGQITVAGSVCAYDLNSSLVGFYLNVQNNHKALYDATSALVAEYRACGAGPVNRNPMSLTYAMSNRESYYDGIRARLDDLSRAERLSAAGSAHFIFLNKTGFRGMYREGPNGFNVSYGNYKQVPDILNWEHLVQIHNLIQNVVFECVGFDISTTVPRAGDFVYMDPPYVPLDDKSFVGYTHMGFSADHHASLFSKIHAMHNNHVLIMMSNSDTKKIRDAFGHYNIETVECRRAINSRDPSAACLEVIVKNY